MKTEIRRLHEIEVLFSDGAELPVRLPEEIGDDAILWVGRPRIRVFEKLWPPVAGLFVFLAYFLVFLILSGSFKELTWGFFALFPVALIVYRHVLLKRFKNTLYIVTDRQAIIAEDKKDRLRVVSFEGKHFQRLVRRERKDGTGDLLFEGVWPTEFSESREFENGFYGIENVAEVERLIRKNLLGRK